MRIPICIDELRSQIASKGLAEFDTIVVLGGRRYVEVVMAAFGGDYSYELPLAGAAGIGVLMQSLRRALDDDREIRAEAGGMMMDLVHWLQGVEGHRFVPLFELDDNLAVKIKYVGSQNRPILRRHPQMEQTIIDLVEKGLEDPDWEGLIYVMGWHDLPHFVPLFVGKTERRGIRRQVSENIRSIRTNTSAFARWGDNIDYHIGDLSHALFRFKAYREPKKPYERWAATLFETPGSTHLVQPVFLYAAPWYTYSTGPSGNVCSVKQVTQELIDLAYMRFPATLLNAHRR
ncbi:MAG TPA: hypothetical protein PLF11_11935 [Bacillota bacterium]|nr:hypothetical protein [Bacillota bacterium]